MFLFRISFIYIFILIGRCLEDGGDSPLGKIPAFFPEARGELIGSRN